MNSRERTLTAALLGAVVLGGGVFLFYQFYLVPLGERQTRIRTATASVDEKKKRISEVMAQKEMLAEWSKLSLPSDEGFSRLKYEQHLHKLIKESGIPEGNMEVKPGNSGEAYRGTTFAGKKEPFFIPLNFTVLGRADLPQLLKLLGQFYSTPLLHRIKLVTIGRVKTGADSRPGGLAQKSTDLEIHLDVEAIIVQGAENRDEILPKEPPAPRNLAEPQRDYTVMTSKNIFYGPTPPPPKLAEGTDPATTVQLTHIGRTEEGHVQVLLCDNSDNKIWFLYPDRTKDIKDIFEIKTKKGDVHVTGVVTRVEDRDVVFRVGDKQYSIHLGQTIADALRKPLSEAEVRVLASPRNPDSSRGQ